MLNNNLLVLKNRTKAAAEPKFDIAGFPNSSDIVTTPPKILEANFLNSDDIFEIKTKVLALANEWQYLKYNSKSILSTRMLPPGRYARSSSQYKKDVAQYKNLMLDNFSRIYESIRLRLVEHFQVDLAYHSSTHYPGFHIFSLTANNEYGEYNFYNFHQDVFPFLNKFIQCETVYSCVIPIELPNDNGSLLYVTSDKQSSGSHEKIQYRIGDLLIWQGNLIHSIEPFTLQGDETRITMQFHIALSNDSGIIFW